MALFRPQLKEVASQVGIVKKISNEKARKMLDWQPITKETTIVETAQSLIDHRLV
jgi:hypothetical protein